jgi:hypothetical protein
MQQTRYASFFEPLKVSLRNFLCLSVNNLLKKYQTFKKLAQLVLTVWQRIRSTSLRRIILDFAGEQNEKS